MCTAICQQFNPGHGTCNPADCSTMSGSSVTVHCNDSYQLEGSSSVLCLQNGNWDKPTPHCVGNKYTDIPTYINLNLVCLV